jgi:hypothetical protein
VSVDGKDSTESTVEVRCVHPERMTTEWCLEVGDECRPPLGSPFHEVTAFKLVLSETDFAAAHVSFYRPNAGCKAGPNDLKAAFTSRAGHDDVTTVTRCDDKANLHFELVESVKAK